MIGKFALTFFVVADVVAVAVSDGVAVTVTVSVRFRSCFICRFI